VCVSTHAGLGRGRERGYTHTLVSTASVWVGLERAVAYMSVLALSACLHTLRAWQGVRVGLGFECEAASVNWSSEWAGCELHIVTFHRLCTYNKHKPWSKPDLGR